MAHRGVLFLDELPEFGHRVLEVIELEADVGLDQASHSKSVFSAKITAHKPA